jgi:hypothetical protein
MSGDYWEVWVWLAISVLCVCAVLLVATIWGFDDDQ